MEIFQWGIDIVQWFTDLWIWLQEPLFDLSMIGIDLEVSILGMFTTSIITAFIIARIVAIAIPG